MTEETTTEENDTQTKLGLYRVRVGKFLHLPLNIASRDRLWLKPGGIVDIGDEFMLRAISGQEYKLEPAPEGSAPTLPIDKRIERAREDAAKAAAKPSAAAQRREKLSPRETEAPAATGTIQKPDARPPKAHKKETVPAE